MGFLHKNYGKILSFFLVLCFLFVGVHGLHGGHGILLGNFWVLWLGIFFTKTTIDSRMHQPETHRIPMDQKNHPEDTLHGRNLTHPTWTKGKIIRLKKCLKGKGYVSSKESRGFSIPPSNNHAPMKLRGMNSPEDERNRVRPHLVVWIGGKHLSVQQEIQREIGNIKHGKP